jgi:hypothetical protein
LPLSSNIRKSQKKARKSNKRGRPPVGAPAVFAALKRTYGKKERICAGSGTGYVSE